MKYQRSTHKTDFYIYLGLGGVMIEFQFRFKGLWRVISFNLLFFSHEV